MLALVLHVLLFCVPALAKGIPEFGLHYCRNECVFQLFADPTDGKTVEMAWERGWWTNGTPDRQTVEFVNGRAQFFYTSQEASSLDDPEKITLMYFWLGLPYKGCKTQTLALEPALSEEHRCVDVQQKCGAFKLFKRYKKTALTVYTDVWCRCTPGSELPGYSNAPGVHAPVRMVSGIKGEEPC